MVVEALEGIIHVAVLINPPVLAVKVALDHFLHVDQEVAEIPPFRMLLPVKDISLGRPGMAVLNQYFFHQVLYVFDGRQPVDKFFRQKGRHLVGQLAGLAPVLAPDSLGRFVNSIDNPFLVKVHYPAVALDDFLRYHD
ncbi:hypothetical protein MOOR_28360 [Moorella thermoacetica]|uniref:Uncharacterized protein n=1 Tax=Neomoorella thermoacetica TaxID=1525 RepID=A0A1J5JEA4_NEOTH|nr:hypothetical protein MOOR_28360 [Moorella thermoacetica]